MKDSGVLNPKMGVRAPFFVSGAGEMTDKGEPTILAKRQADSGRDTRWKGRGARERIPRKPIVASFETLVRKLSPTLRG